jgi:Holliday junction DNA helicase RuvB
VIDLLLDSGPNARSVQIKLNRFTLAGATTRLGLLSNPLRSRFGLTCRLDYYSDENLMQIISRTTHFLKISVTDEAARAIAKRSRGSPRICNNLIKWVRDYAQMHNITTLNESMVKSALELLAIDELGLDEMDKKFLLFMIEQHNGGPVGLKTLATALGEDHVTLSEVHEPYLIMQGLLRRTQRGREVTDTAYKHFGKEKLP